MKEAGLDASPRATGPFAVYVLGVDVLLASGGPVFVALLSVTAFRRATRWKLHDKRDFKIDGRLPKKPS
jgi:hypothetical protein